LKTTGQKKLFYLGHSQGTTSFFVMATELPEYQNKIQAMFAMAPVAYCTRLKSPVARFIATFFGSIDVCSFSANRKIVECHFIYQIF
jgi:pimeloyl-ACP methyl ester carboxylesterase